MKHRILTLIALFFVAFAGSAFAQAFTTERVTFQSAGETLVGTLYLPAGLAYDAQAPAVVVTGSWTTVKEQMAGLYAEALAERGFAALAFDFRYWGESSGTPRNYESPAAKIADIKQAVAYLSQHPRINAAQIGGLGVCASAGYMAYAVAQDDRLRAFATVSAWLHTPETARTIYGDNYDRFLADGQAAAQHFQQTGETRYVPAFETGNADAAMSGPSEGSWDYYANPERGAIDAWDNAFAQQSWAEWLTFDAVAVAPQVNVPTLFVHTDNAALPNGVRDFHDAMPGPKTLFWTTGQHMDFYDKPTYVGRAANVVAQHFAEALNAEPVTTADAVQAMLEERAVINTINTLFISTDQKDWAGVEAALAPVVNMDQTSLVGGEPMQMTNVDIAAAWEQALTPIEAVHHQASNFRVQVTGNTATAFAHGIATHYLPNPTGENVRTFVGTYDFTLVRTNGTWRIDGFRYNLRHLDGNLNLEESAGL